jgi:hypothetical protein
MCRTISTVCVLIPIALLAGCAPAFGPQAKFGVTFYCPGAGNIDFGDQGVRVGLERAGYKGQVASVMWTVSLNPAIDQLIKGNARVGAARLAECIQQYRDQYPQGEINIVGLSAGTGVAVWALEDLKPECQVNNVVLLSSSLYHRYDISKALARVRGRMYVYYSPNDAILAGPMKVFGTIDGVFFEDGVGAVGLHPPTGADRIENIPWQPEFAQYGYYGGHQDSTSPEFIYREVAPQLIGRPTNTQPGAATAIAPAKVPPAENPN